MTPPTKRHRSKSERPLSSVVRVQHYLYGSSFYVPKHLGPCYKSIVVTLEDGESIWEDSVVQLICAYLRPGTTAMVVGAGIGCHAVAMLVMTNTSDVICIETDTYLFDILRHNLCQCLQAFPATEKMPSVRLCDQSRTPLRDIGVKGEISFILVDLSTSSEYACRIVASSLGMFEHHRPVILLQKPHLACVHLQDAMISLLRDQVGYTMEDLAPVGLLFLPPLPS